MAKLNAAKVGAVLLWGCAAGALADDSAALFEQHEFATGFPSPQTVVVGAFGAPAANAAPARIAVAHVDADGKRRLRLFGFDGAGWAPVVDAELRRDAAFIDVASVGNRDRLILYGGGRFTWFDVAAARERPLLAVASSYKADWGEIPFVDVTRDIDLDGRDDLLLPGLHGFSLAMAKADGSYTDVLKIGPPEPFLNAMPAWEDRLYRERASRPGPSRGTRAACMCWTTTATGGGTWCSGTKTDSRYTGKRGPAPLPRRRRRSASTCRSIRTACIR